MEKAFHKDGAVDKVGLWDQEAVCRNSVRALLGTLIGGPSDVNSGDGIKERWLTDFELDELLEVTALYRRRGSRGAGVVKLGGKMTSAQQISGILQMALRRCPESNMASDEARAAALPILVSAIIGGAEIYPLLLQWATRHLAVSPGLQDALRADCRVEIGEWGKTEFKYGSLMQKTINYLAWAHPYSAAIGPPRKITENVVVDVNVAAPHMPIRIQTVQLDKEAIMFIVHPGLTLDWNTYIFGRHLKPKPKSSVGTSVEPSPVSIKAAREFRSSAESATEEVQACKSSHWPMFGIGERSCIASEMSVNFLSAMLCALITTYEIRPSKEAELRPIRDLFAYKEDGSLLVPEQEISLQLVPIKL
ncbi:hypothetical protein B484DRAFT_478746 [Ochromonadaceae sp. CCMP2298]|nr:hypothetical protein B484DRAFT_478746 [Ochromonadaceae sp. CCMP2298]